MPGTTGQALSAFALAAGLAAFATAEDTVPDVEMTLKPRLCALANNETQCREAFDVTWRSEAPADLCLYLASEEEGRQRLECWQQQERGHYRHPPPIEQSLRFQLRLANGDALVSEAEFQVAREQVQYRQRRRRPWHFF